MKKIALLLLFLYTEAAGQQLHYNMGKIHAIASAESRVYLRTLQLKAPTAASTNFHVTYYRCRWNTHPAVRYISGSVTSYFIITAASDHIVYDLSDSLGVDSVKQGNQLLSFSHTANTVLIRFGAPVAAGEMDSVTVYYHGVPASTGFGSFVNSVHQGVPVMWTLSEPYGSRDWWPCKNGLDDKADSIDVYITAPSQYTAVSNGLHQSRISAGENTVTHWKHRYPIATYLVCMAVSDYTQFDNHVLLGNSDLLMQTFCYPESLSLFQQNTPLVLASLQYFSKIFGPYPFLKEKYGHVQFGWGGGQEHQTSTFIVTPDESLMAHELAHQWFGDRITCASWQHIWLNEGFATHLASMDMESKYPAEARNMRAKEIAYITSAPGGSVFVADTTDVNRIFNARLTYIKGSHLLYMLRWILGDSVFFDGMRSYLNDPALSNGFARTTDLQRNLEKVSGRKLDYFFKEWFYGQGYPSYHVQWSQLDPTFVRIKISQTTSDLSVPFFSLPVALDFKNATQEKIIVADNKTNGETVLKELGFVADTVIIDPDFWLITKGNIAEKISADASGKNRIRVFPSPFVQQFNVYFSNFSTTKAGLKIYDGKGALVLEKDLLINHSLFYQVNTGGLSRGIYFIKIQTENGVKFATKILKQ